MARQEVLRLSRELRDHVHIDPDKLTVSEVKKDDRDNGWWVTLIHVDWGEVLTLSGVR